MIDSLIQQPPVAPSGFRARLRDRRRLQRIDRLGARLGRFDAVDALLGRVHDRLVTGWVQDAWFTTVEDGDVRLHLGTLRAQEGRSSERACLVAAVAIEALPGTITGPVAHGAVSTLWNVLHGGGGGDGFGSPGVTATRAYDLVRWNDEPDRRQSDVLALVDASRGAIARSAEQSRAELASA